jgi:hypothetical protein
LSIIPIFKEGNIMSLKQIVKITTQTSSVLELQCKCGMVHKIEFIDSSYKQFLPVTFENLMVANYGKNFIELMCLQLNVNEIQLASLPQPWNILNKCQSCDTDLAYLA